MLIIPHSEYPPASCAVISSHLPLGIILKHILCLLNNQIFYKAPLCFCSSCSSSHLWKHPSQIHFLLLLPHWRWRTVPPTDISAEPLCGSSFWHFNGSKCSNFTCTRIRRLTQFFPQDQLETVCTFSQKYCVLLPQTQLEQVRTLSLIIWLCWLENVPTSRWNFCCYRHKLHWEMSWLWVKGTGFVATNTA